MGFLISRWRGDTIYVGADLDILFFNMRRASVNLDRIDKVVLSHEHRDHVGGIRVFHARGHAIIHTQVFSERYKRVLTSFRARGKRRY